MSTIASPRPSFTLSSRRGSASTDNTIHSNSASKPTTAIDRATLRRNRTALRDYYNLQEASAAAAKTAESSTSQDPSQQQQSQQQRQQQQEESPLDQPNFSPESYVQHLLSTSNLESALRIEAGLLSDIRSLDGEKKALVYDNYSKLIAATDTIRAMREKMEEKTPTTSTLEPAIGHIAEVAVGLKRDFGEVRGYEGKRQGQREVVRWVLDSPERMREMVERGEEEEAKEEWERVEGVLVQWEGVEGVGTVRKACLEALGTLPEG